MCTLTEIERAADALSADELRALLGHVEARLKVAETGGRGKAAERLMRTLQELSRPMGGKSWSNRDELHEMIKFSADERVDRTVKCNR